MEMIPDQKPPVPKGQGPLGKAVFFGAIALLITGMVMYFLYPPLRIVGRATMRNGEELTIYRGKTFREGALRRHIAIVEIPQNIQPNMLAQLAKGICEEVLDETQLLGSRQRIAPVGQMTVRFVQGGRYLYRFYEMDDWQMAYARSTCTVAPYLSGDLEGWALNRWKFTDDDGDTELEVWFRWTGGDERPDLPLKETCENVVSNPPRELRARMGENIQTINIVAERGFFGSFYVSSWVAQRFNRVKNLCIEIKHEEEET